MATKKAPSKKALASSLLFKIEWIFDPGPPFLRLDKAGRIRVNQLKANFAKQVNEVIKGQK